MQVITETELLDRITAFRERHDMAPTTFGRRATGEPQLISSIEGGRSPSLKVVQRVIAFMAEVDAAAALRAKLTAEPEPAAAEEEQPLPFCSAPVNRTGASSLTSSSTIARPTSPRANDSCPACSTAPASDAAAARPNPSCSDNETAGESLSAGVTGAEGHIPGAPPALSGTVED